MRSLDGAADDEGRKPVVVVRTGSNTFAHTLYTPLKFGQAEKEVLLLVSRVLPELCHTKTVPEIKCIFEAQDKSKTWRAEHCNSLRLALENVLPRDRGVGSQNQRIEERAGK